MVRKLLWVIVTLVLVVGVGLSVRDYRLWHAAEIGKFGQGNVAEIGLADAKALALPYSAFVGSFRLKPPVDWTVTENSTLKNMWPVPALPTQNLVEIVRFQDAYSTAKIVVYAQAISTDLTTFANAQAVGITRDRGYITVGDTPVTILTWERSEEVLQKAVLVWNDTALVVEATTNVSAWPIWAKTFEEIYRSWTPI